MVETFNELHEAKKKIERLKTALQRISIGISGRYESGLLPTEIAWGSQGKCDWKLAEEALTEILDGRH